MTELAPLLQAPYWSHGERQLICTARHDETRDGDTVTATTFTFQTAPQASRFHYLPGQFLLINVPIDGQTHSRAYSLCSAPTRPHALAITVKRVAAGRVSNYLIDTLQPGMTLAALPPQGQFHLPAQLPSALLLLSAGSGVTPMIAITRTLRDLGLQTPVHFVYSARHAGDLIFRDELLALAAADPHFHLTLLLESLPDAPMPLAAARLVAGRLQAGLLAEITAGLADYQIYLCGPSGYIDAVHALLADPRYADVPLYEERFSAATLTSNAAATAPNAAQAGAHFALSVPAFGTDSTIAADETLLDALEREGLPIIGACRAGVCGSCKCKVEAGRVESSSTLALTPDQVAAGYVLACSSKARSDLQLALG
ncbi:flavin reductase family protein [Pseudaeromonas sharmana]|uniref:Flavin reductase family protein n=1 Tax=Pseudaeromonas sharmana TaxID=328412 RepID=A0ABV8CJ57_9GAMM